MYFSYIDLNNVKDSSIEVFYIYKLIEELHRESPDRDFTLDELSSYFYAKYPDCDKDSYADLFKRAGEAEISEDAGQGILSQIKRRQAALKLSEKAFELSQGRSSADEVKAIAAELDVQEQELDEIEGIDLDLDNLLDSAVRIPGLRWRLNFLNKSLGSLRRGDFGFVVKRPETGGTAFLASEVSHMLRQTDGVVVWINNEEGDQKVALRLYQAYFGVTLKELTSNAVRYKEAFKAEIGNRFKFYGIEHANKASVEKICAKYGPVLIVYDQLDKITGFEADRDDLRLGAIYQWARELAKRYGAAIGVTQADGTAEGVKYLNMGHVANSKTSKAAEADFILGIGKSHNPEEELSRFISICKNKLIGDTDTMERFRHGQMECLLNPNIMHFEDVISYE